MFINNKYYKWYKELTTQKDRDFVPYTEKHHIIPKCMGGSDKQNNLVILTAREHYIAHLLLTKCVSKEFLGKINCAYVMMATVQDKNQKRIYRVNSKMFEIRKLEAIKYKQAYKHTEEAKRNISKNLKGVPKKSFTEEHKFNISKSHIGQKAWNKGLKGVQKSSSKQKAAVSAASKGMAVCWDKELLMGARVSVAIYRDNKNRYISYSSKEYKLNYKGVINGK
jgi:hypothetical protein